MRGHVQTLNASRVVTPYMARCRLPLTTTLRSGTRATYRSRFLGAYGHRRPTAETTFPDAHQTRSPRRVAPIAPRPRIAAYRVHIEVAQSRDPATFFTRYGAALQRAR